MKPAARRKARQLATQAIYQWQMTNDNVADIEFQFTSEEDNAKADLDYFRQLLAGVTGNVTKLDQAMASSLSRKLEELDRVEHAILLIGMYELLLVDDLPPKVAINEAIELAKVFAAEDSHKFVNGVMDKVLRLQQYKD
ncbi:transcription antitermination factor NusB [Alginatibacterium sediminis]|uniref:Transcription antitermination protein NusB n=1 Tax=Alginatibacterium sediminis TaxID=2164068 RepID=A0A420ED67_9ALTE|nr:transcription antitermination factor NusB [Alginatibacterium sediminis]RKF18572.1 transcription antitermination factor NusB [Alginatibacterium sediminis]